MERKWQYPLEKVKVWSFKAICERLERIVEQNNEVIELLRCIHRDYYHRDGLELARRGC